jgi:protein farnesyltransferase subunit beta
MEVGTPQAYASINREAMYAWLCKMKQADGSFIMHDGGEVDTRGSYCALSVAAFLNLLTDELTHNVADFVQKYPSPSLDNGGSSQTYEGGVGGYPGVEAHGGYTFCAVATLAILDKVDVLDIHRLAVLFISTVDMT